MNQDALAKLFFSESQRCDTHLFGSVAAVNDDGSYQVKLNSSSITTRAIACCEAAAGDRVLVLIMRNGRCVATAKILSA